MADDKTTINTGDLTQANQLIDSAKKGLEDLHKINTVVSNGFTFMQQEISKAGLSLKDFGNIGSAQASKLGLLTTALIGTQKVFEQIGNVDTKRLTTFSGQIEKLTDILTKPGTAASVLTKGMQILGNMLINVGESSNKVNEAMKKGPAFLADYAKNVLASADNSLKLQNALIQLTSSAGNANDLFQGIDSVFKGVGNDLSNLNNITEKYNDVLNKTAKATGIYDRDILAGYAASINSLPGGFKALMTGMELGGKATNVLTVAQQLATGTGRKYEDVMKDVSEAVLDYGASFKTALQYSSSVSEVAKTFQIRVEDVQSALMSSLDAFKYFSLGEKTADDITDSLTHSMYDMMEGFKQIGVPAKTATKIISDYMNSISDLNIAQEAFISKQTGGPGGLAGGFQIEKMLRAGDIEGVKKKVEETLKKMTGPLVSLDQAASSEQAAKRYQYQLQLLQQGPLGKLAQGKEQAMSLLEELRVGKPGTGMKTGGISLQENIEQGAKIEQLSMTKLTEAINDLTDVMTEASHANLTTTQRVFAARTGAGGGTNGEGRGINTANQEHLRAMQERAMYPAGLSPAESVSKDFMDLIKSLPSSLAGSVKAAEEGLLSKNKETQQEAAKRIMALSKEASTNADFNQLPRAQKEAAEKTINHLQDTVKKTIQNSSNNIGLFKPGAFTNLDENSMLNAAQNGANVNANLQKQNQHQSGSQHIAGATTPVPVVLAGGSTITVNMPPCPHCGRTSHATEQGVIQSAPSMANNKSGY